MNLNANPLVRALVAAFLLLEAVCAGRADPDAQAILKNARMAQTDQQRTLSGHLRVQSTGRIIPFTMVLAGDTIRYEFKDDAIVLRLGETGSHFWKRPTETFTRSRRRDTTPRSKGQTSPTRISR